ncbi:MAG: prepilin peptidase [Methylococcales bacterium]|nr:prepilin peptidase [Methylococcales bacterium]
MYYDIAERRIPNRLVAVFILVIPAVLFLEQGYSVLLLHLAAAGIVFLSSFIFWFLGWLGAGDVKLLALVALIVGLSIVPELLLNTALCGLVLAVMAIVLKGSFRQTGKRLFAVVRGMPASEMEQDANQAKLPYAVAIAAGAVLTVSGVSPLP